MLEIGKHYVAKPEFTRLEGVKKDKDGASRAVPMRGRCVYIHPRGRFVTLAFPMGRGVLRECFRPEDVAGQKSRKEIGK